MNQKLIMFRLRGAGRHRLTCLFTSALLLLVAGLIDDASAATSRSAEAWVLRKVAAGEDAYLNDEFPEESGRVLSADFVRRLLTNKIPGLKVPPHGVQIYHAIVKESLNLRNEEIPHTVGLYYCTFEKDVTFSNARFKASVNFWDSYFYSAVDFNFARVAGNFEAEKAHFLLSEVEPMDATGELRNKVEFIDTQVGGFLLLDSARFERPVILYGVRVEGNLRVSNAYFSRDANFELMEVGRHAFFNLSDFQHSARFYRVKVAQNFEALGARFNAPFKNVSFESLSAYVALFKSDKSGRNVVFNGPVRFFGLNTTTHLELDDAVFNNEADLRNMVIKGHVSLVRTVFNRKADFWSTSVSGTFTAPEAKFYSELFLDDLKADVVQLKHVVTSNHIHMAGFTYRDVNEDGVANLHDMVGRAKFDAGAYEMLESYFRRVGNTAEANNLYISRKKRERGNLKGLDWVRNVLFHIFVAYGRRPEQVLIPSGVIIGFGWWLFGPKNKMQPRDEREQIRPYNAFLYSLDLFLPVIDLRIANAWEPEASRQFARAWAVIHVIAGWVLITIFVVAITGLVR